MRVICGALRGSAVKNSHKYHNVIVKVPCTKALVVVADLRQFVAEYLTEFVGMKHLEMDLKANEKMLRLLLVDFLVRMYQSDLDLSCMLEVQTY